MLLQLCRSVLVIDVRNTGAQPLASGLNPTIAGLANGLVDIARGLPGGIAALGDALGDLAARLPEVARQLASAIEAQLSPVERGQMAAAQSTGAPTPRPAAEPSPSTYTVRRGDTLSEIANANGTDWQTLARVNNLRDPDMLQVGQRLTIPGAPRADVSPAGTPATAATAPSPAGGTAASGVSAAGLDAIFRREAQAGVSNRPHWPGGASGVTLGPGYDLKGRTPDSVVADLTAIGVDRGAAQQIARGAGLSGAAARDFAAANRSTVNLTATQETALLGRTVAPYADAVRAQVRVPLNQNQFDALVSFAYNIGTGGFEGSTTLRRLNAGDYAGAADAMRMWNKSDGAVVQGLVNRREAEVRQFNTPGAPAVQPRETAPAAPTPRAPASTNDFAARIEASGDAQARADFAAGRKVVVALRTDTNVAANDNGRYDDRIAVVWRDAAGQVQVREFAGNTEPSGQYRFDGAKGSRGYGVDMNGDGRPDLGRIEAGSYRYTQQSDQFLGNTYFRPDRTTPAQRDTNGDGRFDASDRNGRDATGAGRSMLIHQGGAGNTWSAGCQTLAGADFNAFVAALGGQRSFSYVLANANP